MVSTHLSTGKSRQSILNSIQNDLDLSTTTKKVQMWTLKRWKKMGMAYCMLAGAGMSIHLCSLRHDAYLMYRFHLSTGNSCIC